MDAGNQQEKHEHPRASANIFSALTFWYESPVIGRSIYLHGSTTFLTFLNMASGYSASELLIS
jgi:hypothetical protein